MIRRDCPTVVVVSPPCTAFSIANQGEVDEQTLRSAVEMVRFSMEVCALQHKSGRHFIFEHPQSSRAWSLNEVVKMMYCDGVTNTTFHQCMYGLMSSDSQGRAPALKPTSVITNHPALAEVLQERCSGNHRHAQLVGKGECSRAACYPRGLCDAVVKGIEVIKRKRDELNLVLRSYDEAGRCTCGSVATSTGAHSHCDNRDCSPEDVLYEVELEDMCEQDPSTWEDLASQRWQEYSQSLGETLDSTTGEILDPAKVQAGCDEEIGFMSQMGVWDRVTREQARNDPEGKIVGTRWVFVKKGDKVRCRLVAQEFAGSDNRERISTPAPVFCRLPDISYPTLCRGGEEMEKDNCWWLT
jgi:hypothetical protein